MTAATTNGHTNGHATNGSAAQLSRAEELDDVCILYNSFLLHRVACH